MKWNEIDLNFKKIGNFVKIKKLNFCKLIDEFSFFHLVCFVFFFLSFQFSQCLTIASVKFYHQFCCCDEHSTYCSRLVNELIVDPAQRLQYFIDRKDLSANIGLDTTAKDNKPKHAQIQLNEQKNRKRPKIVCAIGMVVLCSLLGQFFSTNFLMSSPLLSQLLSSSLGKKLYSLTIIVFDSLAG